MKHNDDSLSTVNANNQQTPNPIDNESDQRSNNADVEDGMGVEERTVADQLRDDDEKKSYGHRISNFLGTPAFAAIMVMGGGTAVAFQAGFNAAMREAGGRSFSSLANFLIGLGATILALSFDVFVLKSPPPRYTRLKEAPWYAWIGGILGTYYVIVNIFLVTVMGAGTVLSVFVCSQVITACLMDHFSITGITKRPYTIWRILASLGLIGCVAVITIF
ncbi:hypothetical protein BJV82DRAFT_614571 [Fennellomyces sp. T-0311]|nr:hypothetical protein BJV82DRAFT_614571 [Fennellomyces sp. T-0311]